MNPKAVQIGPLVFSIFFDLDKIKDHNHKEQENVYGFCDYDNVSICISPEVDVQLQRQTLLHEIMHAAIRYVYLMIDSPTEEQIVTLTAPMLMQALQQPDVKRFIWPG